MRRATFYRWIYSTALTLMLPLLFGYLRYRGIRQPAYRRHWRERLGFSLPAAKGPVIWVHAVSVGETRAAEPVVRALLARHPAHTIVLTHMTPTGRETGQTLFKERVVQCYLPYDTPCGARRFFDHFKPEMGLIMETEIWFNLIRTAQKRRLPLFLVNARLSEKSAKGYGRLATLTRDALHRLSGIAAQTPADAARFTALGAPEATVAGNVKFDVALPEGLEAGAARLAALAAGRPTVLFASTRDGEEALALQALQSIQIPDLLAVIVPRHPQRFDEVAQLLEMGGVPYRRRSADQPVSPETRVLLGDSMGEMFAWYAMADVAVMGGSLLPFGGQNLLEPAAVGCPVLLGPHTFNFAAAAEEAVRTGAARRIDGVPALAAAVTELISDPAQRARMGDAGQVFCQAHRGATRRILDWIEAGTA